MLASIIPGWKYVSAGIGILVFGLLAWWVLETYVLTPSDLHDEDEIVLQAVVEDFQSQILKHLDESDRRHVNLAIVPIPDDTSNQQYRISFKKGLEDSNKRITVDDENLLGKVKADGMALIGNDDEPLTVEAFFESKPELTGVLVFERPILHKPATEVQLTMSAKLTEKVADPESKEISYEKTSFESYQRVSFETQEVLTEGEEGAASTGGGGFWAMLGMTVVGIVAALGIPFLFLPLTDPVSATGNTLLGVGYLAVIVAVAMTPYFLLLGFSGGGPIGFGVLLTGICALWTYKMHDAWSERIGI